MANQFVNLPAPAANGSGAWVDVSTFGALKTITVEGNGGVFEPFVTIEGSNESSPTHGFPIVVVNSPTTEFTEEVVCNWMRATVSNYKGGGAPTVEIGGTDDGSGFAELAVPSGNSAGAGTDVSALGLFKTVQIGGPFRGQINIDVSEDNGTTWSQAFSFATPGKQSAVIAADFMRVTRNGVPAISAGLPDVWIGAANPVGGGGGGGGALIPVHYPVFIPGDSTFNLIAGVVNLVNADTTSEGATAAFPPAASVPNGTLLVVKLTSGNRDDGDRTGTISFVPDAADTLDGYSASFPVFSPNIVGDPLIWVSDGVSDWELISTWNPPTLATGTISFRYVADGTENPAGFVVALPQTRVNNQYNAIGNIGTTTQDYTIRCPPAGYTTLHFTVITGAQPIAGDVLIFTISTNS